MEGILSRTKT